MVLQTERTPELVQVLRTRRAVTEIAEAIGISRAAVSQWRQVPEQHLRVVARITKMPKYKLRPDLFPWRSAMDEVAFLRAYNNTRTLIDSARETGDAMVVTHLCNALLTMLAMIDSLNQRITEMQDDAE